MKKYKVFFPFLVGIILYGWLQFAASHPTLPSNKNPLLFYSNQSQQDLKITLVSALKKAKKSIHIQMYGLTDPDVLDLLKSKKDLDLSIAYDASASGKIPLPQAQPIKCKGLMHRKIIVLDNKRIFFGTANLTPQSLQMHDNLILGLHHRSLAQFLTNPSSNHYNFTIDNQNAELWLLPSQEALSRLIHQIEEAKKTIKIAMFTFTHPQIVKALVKAKLRGVKVHAVVDFYTGRGASSKALSLLQKNHIQLSLSRGQQLLHHKWAIIDSKTLIMGSANWTKAAFEKNQDCFLILHSLTQPQKRFLKKLWRTIEMESEDMIN